MTSPLDDLVDEAVTDHVRELKSLAQRLVTVATGGADTSTRTALDALVIALIIIAHAQGMTPEALTEHVRDLATAARIGTTA